MKRIIIKACLIFSGLIIIALALLYFWIGISVKGNIETAKKIYPGNAEDVLISLMMDENYSATGRTHAAIWTLGQLKSQLLFQQVAQNNYSE